MTTAKPDQPQQRDQALARLLAEALTPAASAEAAGHSACPNAELLAAYAEQGLAEGERERLDSHFAACGRCQKILAVLAVSGDEPLAEQDARRFGELAAAAPAAAAPAKAKPHAWPSLFPERWFWWLAPALSATAAVVLWIALRPISPGGTEAVQTAADYSAARPAEQEADSVIAQANVPPPAAEAEEPRAKAAEGVGPGLEADTQRDAARNEQSSRQAQALGGVTVAGGRDNSAPSAPAARADEALSAREAPAAAAPPAAPAPPARGQESAAEARDAVAGAPQPQARALAMERAQFAEFASPDGSRRWRLSPGGRIERSTDGGRTWQAQNSGVTTELLAGTAPSGQVAWVVGRAGVILRLTDDVEFPRWQRISAPNGVMVDWVGVEARDALRATITSADGRRFSTEDGGRTWTLQ